MSTEFSDDFSDFDPSDPEYDGDGFTLAPEGWHAATVIDHEWKDSRKGDKYASLVFQIEGHGKAWANLNLRHANEKARFMSKRELAKICRAAGCNRIKSLKDLEFKKIEIQIAHESYDGKKRETIKGYRSAGAAPKESEENRRFTARTRTRIRRAAISERAERGKIARAKRGSIFDGRCRSDSAEGSSDSSNPVTEKRRASFAT